MQMASYNAMTGIQQRHGGPFGATVVRNGQTISVAHNTVLHNNDPTCHAEMNAIRAACQYLQCHDLSDCELYTTCEPCPMCWGAIMWSRIFKLYVGVNRFTAAQYGFDDKIFYEEVDFHNTCFQLGMQLKTMESPHFLKVEKGLCWKEFKDQVLTNTKVNRTFKRLECMSPKRNTNIDGLEYDAPEETANDKRFMGLAIQAAIDGARTGNSKEREIFGACVVDTRTNEVLSTTYNEVLSKRDCTATAEITAIRHAAERLRTYNLEHCAIYCTVQPDVMSLTAILWARMSRAYVSASQEVAAAYGFEDGIFHYQELSNKKMDARLITVIPDVAAETAEMVFKAWEKDSGTIY